MKVTALLLAALLYWTAPVNGQQTQPEKRAAEELVEAMQLERATELSAEQTIRQLAAVGAGAPDSRFHEELRDFLREHLTWAQLKPEYVRIYAELFTVKELQQLTAFYRTPVGRKLARLSPEIAERQMESATRYVQPHLPQLLERMQASGQP
jgi:hypothetical protein